MGSTSARKVHSPRAITRRRRRDPRERGARRAPGVAHDPRLHRRRPCPPAPAADVYREAGERAGRAVELRLGVALHFFAAPSMEAARAAYPYYHAFLRPKRPDGGGFYVSPEQFEAGLPRGRHLMIGTSEHVAEKLTELHDALRFDRVQALVDWGALPRELVEQSLARLATEVAPALRRHADAETSALTA